jgi:putative transposase
MRLRLFDKDGDYAAFLRILQESLERSDAPRLLDYCLVPNHWHMVVQAGAATNLSTWMQWVTVTHTQRWHAHRMFVREGPLYQGRFKSFPVQSARISSCGATTSKKTHCGAWLVRRVESSRYGRRDCGGYGSSP